MYTGGTAVGRIVMAAAAKHLTPVTLELGGKCPVYVDKSADLEVTAKRLINTKLMNVGQICLAPDYILAHEEVRDNLVEELDRAVQQMYPDGLQSSNLCRVINKRHLERLTKLLDENHGGKVVRGGKVDKDDLYLDFTVVIDPKLDSKLMLEEIFGPILPILKVAGVEEAINFINDRDTPLAAYNFTKDKEGQERFINAVASGGMCVNDCIYHITNNYVGFGGKGDSGMGHYRGKFSFSNFTHHKAVAIQSMTVDNKGRYPPFSLKELAFTKKLLTGTLVPGWVWTVLTAVLVAVVGVGLGLFHRFVEVDLCLGVGWRS
ncbi:unnamed protein product [Discosporangium mesarthrocarpum]